MKNYHAELFDVSLNVLNDAKSIQVDEIDTAQDGMILLRIEWEELQTRLRDRKLNGLEPAIETIKKIASACLAVAATLQAKMIQQYEQLLAKEAKEIDDKENFVTTVKRRKAKVKD